MTRHIRVAGIKFTLVHIYQASKGMGAKVTLCRFVTPLYEVLAGDLTILLPSIQIDLCQICAYSQIVA